MAAASAALSADPEIVNRLHNPGDYGGPHQVSRFILKALQEQGLVHEATLPPSAVGLHPCNRSKYGANEESSHALLADIFAVGWNPEELVSPLAVEEDPVTSYIFKHSDTMARNSELLAPVIPNSIRAGSLTNGHLTLGLRALVAGMPSSQESITVDGRLSLAHVEAKDPDMAKAALQGWKWQILSHRCAALYGDILFEVLSDTRNISLARSESEVQVMLKIGNMAAAYQNRGETPPWEQIHKDACRTKPACSHYVPDIICFVRNYSGGATLQFVLQFVKYHSRFVSHDRFVGGAWYHFLGTVVFKNKEKVEIPAPLLRWAFLKAQYACPLTKVVNRECRFLTTTDIMRCLSTTPDLFWAANAILEKSRELVAAVGSNVTKEDAVVLFGKLDNNVVRVMLRKQQGSKIQFKTIEAGCLPACDPSNAGIEDTHRVHFYRPHHISSCW